MRRLLAAAGPGIAGAIVAGILFWIINRSYQINNVGWLRRLEWPVVSNPWMWAAIGFVVGLIGSLIAQVRRAAHARAAQDVAGDQGLEYAESFTLPTGAEAMPMFTGWSNGQHAMSGEAGGVRIQIFDCRTIQKGDESDTITDRTVALLPADGLPDFDLRPRTVGRVLLDFVGFEGLSFDHEAAGPADADTVRRFAEQFQLFIGDPLLVLQAIAAGEESDPKRAEREAAVRRLFTPSVMAAVNDFPDCAVESASGHLAVWRGSSFQPPRRRPELLDAAVAFRAALRNTPRTAHEPVVPSRPGSGVVRQATRMRNTLVGGAIGSFIGFVVSAMVISITFFGQVRDGKPGAGLLLEPLVFFGCVLSGAAVGVLIGSRIPVRDRPPGPPEDPVRQRTRWRATRIGGTIGLFVGFFGGFFLFVATKIAFDWKFDNFGVDSALFFLSCFGGGFAGVILGGLAGSRLHRWRNH